MIIISWQVFKNVEVEAALKQNIEASLTIHTLADSNWGQCISKADFTNNLRIQLNPPEKLENIHGVLQFTAYVGSFVKVVPITSLLQASEQFGNISFTRPTLYIFPGCQGDSALFGVNGFNLLVDGGYNRRACFWDFARHLDRVDAMVLSHLGTDNILSINTVLQRKSLENVHPQIGYLYFNAPEKMVQAPIDESGDAASMEKKSLLVNLSEEAKNLTDMAKQLGITPHPCSRNSTSNTVDPINLYHKLGHGSLDMYPLNPVSDSKEMKDFYQQWSKQSASLGSCGPFPAQNATSVCTLLIWKPYNTSEKIVRILFPGNTPQHKIAEGLEKVKEFRFLKFASCTGKDLIKPPVSTRKASGTTRPTSSRAAATSARLSATAKTTDRLNTSRAESARKADLRSTRSTTSPAKTTRTARDDLKKTTNAKDNKDAKPSSAKTRSVTSPTKSSVSKSASPTKSPSPPKTSPAKTSSSLKSSTVLKSPSKSPPKSPSKTPEKEVPSLSNGPTEKTPATVPAPITMSSSVDAKIIEDVPAAVPEPTLRESKSEDVTPVADQIGSIQLEDKKKQPISSNEVSPPKEAWLSQSEDGMNASGDANQKLGANFNNSFSLPATNGVPSTNNDHFEMDEEEIKPQALPDPPSVIIQSPSNESDGMPDYSSKIEADQLELSDFSKAEADANILEKTEQPFEDPAQAIPSSPEPTNDDPSSYSYPPTNTSSNNPPTSFVFNNDEPQPHADHVTMEQNIQYGIDNSRGNRAMGGIQEVDEEECEDNESAKNEKNDEDEELSAFERDDFDEEEIQKSTTSSVISNEENVIEKPDYQEKDYRISAERQFEDVEQEKANQNVNGKADHINGSHLYSFDGSIPNDFIGLDGATQKEVKCTSIEGDRDNEEFGNGASQPFDPVAQWGQPMGLPSPPPPSRSTSGPQKSKAGDKRPTSASTRTSSDTKARGSATARSTASSSRSSTARSGTTARRPGSSRSSPLNSTVPPLPPMTPFYVDLTYIPNHGDPDYCDIEFFKRVRSRYYVLSALSPNPKVLDCLMEAKATWEEKDLEVTLIPTYDNDTLRHWMGLNKEKLHELHMDMTPAVSRCTIQLQDLETSLPAYRLEV